MVAYAPPADVEPALMVYLADVADWLGTSTPEDLKQRLVAGEEVLRVARIGGGTSAKSDEPRISVQAFTLLDPDKPRSSHKLIGQVTSKVLAMGDKAPVITVPDEYGGGTVLFEGGSVESGAVQRPWPDAEVLVVECIYRISTRR